MVQKTERKARNMWGCEGLYGFSCLSLRDFILVIVLIIIFTLTMDLYQVNPTKFNTKHK